MTYSRWADTLVALGFDYRSYLTTQHFVVPPVLYVLWVTLVALSKVLFGGAWPTGIVILNWIAATLLAYGLARTTGTLTTVIVGLAATLIFVTSMDVLLFLPYVLSDIIFMGLAGAILLTGLSIAGTASSAARGRRLVTGTALVLAACVFRPTAPPLILYWCACLVVAYRRDISRTRVWLAIGALGVVAAIAVVAQAALLQDPSRWPGGGESGWIRQLSDESQQGIVVFGRPETYRPPPRTLLDFVTVTLTKWVYYFAPWMAGYGRSHKLAGGAFFLTAYALSLLAVFFSPRWRLTSLLVVYLGAFSLFHGAQQIDYDHRYRLPVLPALSVLAALGLEQLAAPLMARRRTNAAVV